MKRSWLLVLLCLMLTGCAETIHRTGDKKRLKVAVFNGAYDAAYWQECEERFEEVHPDVDVELQISANIGNILLPRIDVGDVPDVVYLASTNDSEFTQKLMQEHRLASLEDVFTPQLQERFLDHVLESGQLRPYLDRELYLAPLYYNVTGLWYNKALFAQHGYQVPQTWDEFLALGEQAKADGIDLFTFQGLNPTYLEAMLWPMLAEKIGIEGLNRIFRYDDDAWLQDGIQDVLDVFQEIGKQGYMKEDTIILSYWQAQKRFIDQEALFLPCGNWLLQEMDDQIASHDDFAFMNVPSFTAGASDYATVMVEQIYVPKDAQQPELGKAFVAFQYESEMVHLNEEIGGGYVPLKQDTQSVDVPQPYQIFEYGVLPITASFDVEYGVDSDRVVFEQVAKLLSQEQTSEEMIAYMTQYYENIK